MEETNKTDGKTFAVSKKGLAWYTLFSFLLVTLLIFIAVMMTNTRVEERVGARFSKQLALAHAGLSESEVSELNSVKSVKEGAEVFEVSYVKDGEKVVCYIDANSAALIDPAQPPHPEEMGDKN